MQGKYKVDLGIKGLDNPFFYKRDNRSIDELSEIEKKKIESYAELQDLLNKGDYYSLCRFYAAAYVDGYTANEFGTLAVEVEIKFKDAKITYIRVGNNQNGTDNLYSFITRDKATLRRLQKFVQTDLFEKILTNQMGKEGTFIYECR